MDRFATLWSPSGARVAAPAGGAEEDGVAFASEDAAPWIKPLIWEDNVKDVHALKVPDPGTHPVFSPARDVIPPGFPDV